SVPQHTIENNQTTITIEEESAPLKVFGNHNLLNIHAAWLVCRQLGISAAVFVKAIASFTGAAKRLELLAQADGTIVYRDFAHAPSKVKATIEAVKAQYPDKKLFALLELHTYSSLNEAFMNEYNGVMADADVAVVFYSSHALQLKRLPLLQQAVVEKGFAKEGLDVLTTKEALQTFLKAHTYENSIVLFMSSGTYDGFDLEGFSKKITGMAVK
ncbi:MAG TPA: cyanophycin synthetase, partial [Chitinophagaceae bacterium]|nr:cyanophycin synthetase [Chitinophagaceae bacterium]